MEDPWEVKWPRILNIWREMGFVKPIPIYDTLILLVKRAALKTNQITASHSQEQPQSMGYTFPLSPEPVL